MEGGILLPENLARYKSENNFFLILVIIMLKLAARIFCGIISHYA